LGLDAYTFQTGPKFQGIKLIPPGWHLLHSSGGGGNGSGVRSSQWLWVPPGGCAHVARWVAREECLEFVLSTEGAHPAGAAPRGGAAQDEEAHRLAAAARALALDASLGPYPLHLAPAWQRLTSHLSAPLLLRLQPASTTASSSSSSSEGALAPSAAAPLYSTLPGVGPGSLPSDRTAHAMDTSACLCAALRAVGWEGLLGELQHAFLSCLVGHSFPALQQWKALLDCLLRAERALTCAGEGGGGGSGGVGGDARWWGEALGRVIPAQLGVLQGGAAGAEGGGLVEGEDAVGLAEGIVPRGLEALARAAAGAAGEQGALGTPAVRVAVGALLEGGVASGALAAGSHVSCGVGGGGRVTVGELVARLKRGEAGSSGSSGSSAAGAGAPPGSPAAASGGGAGHATLEELLEHLRLEGEGELPEIVFE
jgi:hypothetical protein